MSLRRAMGEVSPFRPGHELCCQIKLMLSAATNLFTLYVICRSKTKKYGIADVAFLNRPCLVTEQVRIFGRLTVTI
jgi:hypothetical protein